MNWTCANRNGCLRIIVLGYIIRMPLGGLVWHYLQYVLGLARLGHEVYYVEDSCLFEEDEYAWYYDPGANMMVADPTYGLKFAANTFARVGLGDRWAFYDACNCRWHGPAADRIIELSSSADILLNVSAANPLRHWLMNIPARVLIDTDPAFTQVRALTNSVRQNLASQHTAFFSFGENIASGRSTVPEDGRVWQATRQPVVLDAWTVTPGPDQGKFTTVMAWESYRKVEEYGGIRYGLKSDSFWPFVDLPARSGQSLELALFNSPAPRSLLAKRGWNVVDASDAIRDPWAYQSYIQESRGEFSVAKHGYVISHSGWFSERSACYMASGRPVLLQETGFSDWLPGGTGVVPFTTPEGALAGIEDIHSRYASHCRAARQIAEEYFDARKVLPSLIARAVRP
ncbi:MAG: hypothetical protein HYY30_00880 [Chloroflexi bacterium]|nr:hypothetical protein [Chloroflexota bacterium]